MRKSLLALVLPISLCSCIVVEAPFGLVNAALDLPLAAAQSVVNAPGNLVNSAAGDPAGEQRREQMMESRRKDIAHDKMLKERTERKKAEWAIHGDSPVPEDRPSYVTPRRESGPGRAIPMSPEYQAGRR